MIVTFISIESDGCHNHHYRTGVTPMKPRVRSSSGQVALIPGALLTADFGRVGRADRNEACLGEHPLGRRIVVGCGRPERTEPVSRCRYLAQLPDRHAGKCSIVVASVSV